MHGLAGGSQGAGVRLLFAGDGGLCGRGHDDQRVGGTGLALAVVAVVVADDEGGCDGVVRRGLSGGWDWRFGEGRDMW